MEENKNESIEEIKEENKKEASKKDEVEKKIRKQIEKKQEKESRSGISRIAEYMKEEHKWENYVFIAISIVVLLLGSLILNGSLEVKNNFPVIGSHPTLFAWILIVIAVAALIYALWPFYKPAFPEFKKITWLTWPKFLGNLARTFTFMLVFVAVLYLYDSFISEIFVLIFS